VFLLEATTECRLQNLAVHPDAIHSTRLGEDNSSPMGYQSGTSFRFSIRRSR
jgi:hypothetical protein